MGRKVVIDNVFAFETERPVIRCIRKKYKNFDLSELLQAIDRQSDDGVAVFKTTLETSC